MIIVVLDIMKGISTIGIKSLAGERVTYNFVEGKKDTLFIDMSKYEK